MSHQEPNTKHLAVYDYGTGGIWVLIEAESADAIERRFPWLRVVEIGDPEWVTPEKYDEIVAGWIGPSMRFSLAMPHGWLVETDESLRKA